MADNIKYRFIQNIGDFFPSGYFGEDFIDKVIKISGYTTEQVSEVCSHYVQFRRKYDDYKNRIVTEALRPKDSIRYTHVFHTELLKLLGYGNLGKPYSEHYILDEDHQELIPVRHILRRNNNIQMLIMEMRPLIKVGDEEPAGLFEQQYDDESEPNKPSRFTASHWSDVFTMPEGYKISPAIVNKAVSRIFLLPEDRRPSYILMLAGNTIFLFDKEKWNRGSYLSFNLDDLFSQASISAFRKYYALFHILVCKETLSPDSESIMMDALVEDSYKNAYEVTKDLKEGVVSAVETLANEALWFWQHLPEDSDVYNPLKTIDYTDDTFESEVKDDCLTIVYRLLFLFYAESRTELEILPVDDEVYEKGYSLEMLRDLEQVRLISEESKRGYFIDDSLKRLFRLLSHGHKENQPRDQQDRSFQVRHIDSPMFDDRKLHHMGAVRFRNEKWQQIICALSLSKKKQGKGRGRISYANLGVNQLGSVYESLLAYRGFYAEEDYIEVHKENHPEDGTFLVPYSRLDDFKPGEVLHVEDGNIKKLPQGTFVYRLNGRDRQKSASYYTPEVLTRSTVKYTLKAIIDEVREGKRKATDLLDLKILEPAMGAAAFQNEVINQLAEAYLQYRQDEKRKEYMLRNSLDEDELGDGNWRIAPDHYRDELQRVKAYIATKNVYGVDLNPTAIELGKLSLWLNVIHKDMETPFFGHRISLGNAVIGAWFKVYSEKEYYDNPKKYSKKLKNKLIPWWEHAPHKVKFNAKKKRVGRLDSEVYHFLLPDKAMLATAGIKDIKEKAKAEKLAYENAKTARIKDPSIELPSLQTYSSLERMKKMMDDWTKPITYEDAKTLRRLSDKIDKLIVEFVQYQIKVDKLTANNFTVWGKPAASAKDYTIEGYAEKLKLLETRDSLENAHHKLKIIMDYWCSLWFWTPEDAGNLPTRQEYWEDINRILNVELPPQDVHTVRTKIRSSRIVNGMEDMFAPKEYVIDFDDEATDMAKEEDIETEEVEVVEDKALSQEDANKIFAENSGKSQIFTGPRTPVVERLSKQYHFFHPMLEFIEVFWLRDGFDIICGNPPWLKMEVDIQGIMSEKYPEVAIRNIKAADIKLKYKNKFFEECPALADLYNTEETSTTCTIEFMNAYCSYPILVNQKNNLYKCVLANGFALLNEGGFMGMLHPDGIYDDPNAQTLREEVYRRLKFHFQYQNELTLFAEVDHHTKYGCHIYSGSNTSVSFDSIHNLFHPNTIDGCYAHDGHGLCGGIKDANGNWSTESHKSRIVHFTEKELRVLAATFEGNENLWSTTKLVSVHSSEIINVLSKFTSVSTKAGDFEHLIGDGLRENTAVEKGVMERNTRYPNMEKYEMIYSGPHFYVSNPYYKNPRAVCKLNSDYDPISLSDLDIDYTPRSNYKPLLPAVDYISMVNGFEIGRDSDGKPLYDNWIDYYKLVFSAMVGPSSERTLAGSIIPPKTSHVHAVISIAFKNNMYLVELTGMCASLPYDFYMKAIGSSSIIPSRLASFPLGISDKYKSALFARTLLLNCLTTAYSDLWEEMWNAAYKSETWSIEDKRLKPYASLTKEWLWTTPLRNYFERRQALVEIDVISAMALGLSLQDLEMLYTIQFPVLQQNENDTWYDQKGNIVFTCSKGLTGVGCDRPEWNNIHGDLSEDGLTYHGTTPTYVHTIDPTKSELYGGQQVTYYAPYTKCDRIADYRRAWAHFEIIINNQ